MSIISFQPHSLFEKVPKGEESQGQNSLAIHNEKERLPEVNSSAEEVD